MKRTDLKFKYNNILLVDDSQLDNFINEKMIEANNFAKKIYVCTDGKSALEFISNLIISGGAVNDTYPDIMFVDINMPIMDGFKFIENFKKMDDKKLQNCKIVVLTSSINIEDKLKAEAMGSNMFFVNKPLTNAILEQL